MLDDQLFSEVLEVHVDVRGTQLREAAVTRVFQFG